LSPEIGQEAGIAAQPARALEKAYKEKLAQEPKCILVGPDHVAALKRKICPEIVKGLLQTLRKRISNSLHIKSVVVAILNIDGGEAHVTAAPIGGGAWQAEKRHTPSGTLQLLLASNADETVELPLAHSLLVRNVHQGPPTLLSVAIYIKRVGMSQ
jgi:hypothetical protein